MVFIQLYSYLCNMKGDRIFWGLVLLLIFSFRTIIGCFFYNHQEKENMGSEGVFCVNPYHFHSQESCHENCFACSLATLKHSLYSLRTPSKSLKSISPFCISSKVVDDCLCAECLSAPKSSFCCLNFYQSEFVNSQGLRAPPLG